MLLAGSWSTAAPQPSRERYLRELLAASATPGGGAEIYAPGGSGCALDGGMVWRRLPSPTPNRRAAELLLDLEPDAFERALALAHPPSSTAVAMLAASETTLLTEPGSFPTARLVLAGARPGRTALALVPGVASGALAPAERRAARALAPLVDCALAPTPLEASWLEPPSRRVRGAEGAREDPLGECPAGSHQPRRERECPVVVTGLPFPRPTGTTRTTRTPLARGATGAGNSGAAGPGARAGTTDGATKRGSAGPASERPTARPGEEATVRVTASPQPPLLVVLDGWEEPDDARPFGYLSDLLARTQRGVTTLRLGAASAELASRSPQGAGEWRAIGSSPSRPSFWSLVAGAACLVDLSGTDLVARSALEAMCLGVPVLAPAGSAAAAHAELGGGGLWFTTPAELLEAVAAIVADARLAADLGAAASRWADPLLPGPVGFGRRVRSALHVPLARRGDLRPAT